jgi:hypothetical protein
MESLEQSVVDFMKTHNLQGCVTAWITEEGSIQTVFANTTQVSRLGVLKFMNAIMDRELDMSLNVEKIQHA